MSKFKKILRPETFQKIARLQEDKFAVQMNINAILNCEIYNAQIYKTLQMKIYELDLEILQLVVGDLT